MFKYTQSAILNTLDLIKRMIFITIVGIQVGYIGYIGFRLFYGMGIMVLNIFVLALSIIYFIYYVGTYREFYTEEHKKTRFTVKWVFKTIKYGISAYLLVVAIMELLNNPDNGSLSVLVVVLMILSIILTAIFDVIVILIDQQITIITNSIRYDMEEFRKNRRVFTGFLKRGGFDIEATIPPVYDEKMKEKIEKIAQEQEEKKIRKETFLRKHGRLLRENIDNKKSKRLSRKERRLSKDVKEENLNIQDEHPKKGERKRFFRRNKKEE